MKSIDERITEEGLDKYGMKVSFPDGSTMESVGDDTSFFFLSSKHPGRFKQVFVPVGFEHEAIVK